MSLDAIPRIAWFVLAVPVGAAVAVAHLALLHRAIQRAAKHPDEAGLGIMWGFPLRLGLWVPFLWLAARLGLEASVGLILGSLIGLSLIHI